MSKPEGPALSRGDLLGVFGLALALRWASAFFASLSSPFWLALNTDDRAYGEWAVRMAEGQWSDGEVFFLSPLYPYLLGGLYSLLGESRLVAIGLQVLLSAGTAAMLAALGGRLFGRRAGLLTGLLAALYGPLIFFSECLLTETTHLFLVSAGLLCLERARAGGGGDGERPPGLFGALAAGCLLGLAAGARAYFLASVGALVLWLLLRARTRRMALALALGAVLALAPSALHNRIAGGEWVLVNASGGINFYLGNHPGANGRIHPPPGIAAENLMTPGRMRDTFAALAEQEVGHPLGARALSDHYYAKARSWITANPGTWFSLVGLRLRQVVESFEYPGDRNAYQAQRWSPILRWTPVGWALVLALAVAGCLSPAARRGGAVALQLVNLVALLVLLGFLVTDRFRLTLLPGCLVLAGLALDGLLVRGERRTPASVACLLTAGGVLALSLALGWGRPKESYMSHFNLALQYANRGELEAAEASLRRSVGLRPQFLRGHGKLAQVLIDLGRMEEARVEARLTRKLAREQGVSLGGPTEVPGGSGKGGGGNLP